MPYDILCNKLNCKYNRPTENYPLREGRKYSGGFCTKLGIILETAGPSTSNDLVLLWCQNYTNKKEV